MLAELLNDPNIFTVKVAVQCFATVYALLFRMLYERPFSLALVVFHSFMTLDVQTETLANNGTY